MDPLPLFVGQFVWFVIVWATIAIVFVRPRMVNASTNRALAVWVAPQMFRVLGVGLLVPNLSPNMPQSFAISTAVGDTLTALLALGSVIALERNWTTARATTWVCTVVGTTDLTIAMIHAARVEAVRHLAAQWFVPAVLVPLMVVCHVMAIHTLLATRRDRRKTASN